MRRIGPTAIFLAVTALPALAQQDPEIERMKKEVERLKVDNAALLRQLKEQSAELRELLKTPKATFTLLPEEPAAALATTPLPPAPGSSKPREATVTATANEIGLVVISAGKEEGVREGEEFTLSRDGIQIGKIVIDRCDQKWSAGKITQKSAEPRVGDRAIRERAARKPSTQERLDALKVTVALENASLAELLSNLSQMTEIPIELDPAVPLSRDVSKRSHTFKVKDLSGTNAVKILASSLHLESRITPDGRVLLGLPPPEAAALAVGGAPALGLLSPESAQELRNLRKELDDVRSQVRALSDHLVPSWQGEGLTTEEAPDVLRSQLKMSRGVVIRQVREGSRAARAGLKPLDVVRDLEEPDLLFILKDGGRIALYRQGKLEVFEVDRSR